MRLSFSGRVPALDGVRGVAIIAVFLSHATTDAHAAWPDTWFSWGWMGVDLFFVLSGFLITGILLDALHERPAVYCGSFYARRVLRLAPALCLFLLSLLFVLPHLGLVRQAELTALRAEQRWYWSYLVNVLVAKEQSFSATPLGTAPLWSLAVEQQFYLVWPFFVARAGTPERVRNLSIAAIALSMGLRSLGWQLGYGGAATYVLTLTRGDALAWGALLASLARMPDGDRRLAYLQWRLVFVGAMLLAFAVLMHRDSDWPSWEAHWVQVVGMPGIAMLCTALVSYAIGAFSAPFAWRPLTTIGAYSYGFYLWHAAVLVLVGRTIPARGATFVLVAAVACAVPTALSWLAVERPALRLKRYFPMTRRPPSIGSPLPSGSALSSSTALSSGSALSS